MRGGPSRPGASRADAPALHDAARPRLAQPRRPSTLDVAPDAGDEHPDAPLWIGPNDARFTPPPLSADAAPGPFFGLLHAHTFISDGSGTPEAAFARARAAHLDFLGVTPHNHAAAESGAKGSRRDGVLIATNPDLYGATGSVTVTRRFRENGVDHEEEVTTDSLQAAAAAATDAGFVALFGQEFSTISSGNHANVFQPEAVLTDIADGAYRPFYERFAAGPALATTVVQFNHPNVHDDLFYGGSQARKLKAAFNDYGYDEYGEDFSRLVEAADPVVAMVEVLSGPALDPIEHARFHYADGREHENDYYFYLVQGFHVSPSVGQDNHFETWGTATPARMGVYAAQRTAASLIEAMRANRTYATEDSDLALAFSCNGHPMGSRVTLAEGTPIHCLVGIADPTDADLHTEADLIYGDVLAARNRSELVEWKARDGLVESVAFEGPGDLHFDEYEASGKEEFFYVRVQQADGDRAWSAPIWISPPAP